ncbi:hypothetical protein Hsar01_00290 [Haloferula sargassicola]|uniref:Uncharacterized protein n=2 Tax=Haloferula sargassicola TaxID=490096 RepID=A0ABP9UP55_9BACT
MPDAGVLAEVLPLTADPTAKNVLRSRLRALDPFPAAALIQTLGDRELAVRLGALEILEEQAGGDFSFNPWLPPGDPRNAGALARWQQWAASDHEAEAAGPLLGDDQRRGYLRDLLSDDRDKAARARQMLETDGLGSVGFLEEFLQSSPALPEGSRAKVRQAQYQIVLARAFGGQAPNLARNLTFGNRDQILSALGSLRSAGLAALPILRDYLQHPDSLVRESAIDAMLASGGSHAVPLVASVLTKEPDSNVIHGALRQLKDVAGTESLSLAASFLDRDDEDLLVSAIQTCLALSGERNQSFGGSSVANKTEGNKKVNEGIIRLLDHPAWRVRTAAVEFISARRLMDAREKVVSLLDDPDEFVRYQAIKAAGALSATEALPKLKGMFLAGPEMVGPVLEGYAAFGRSPDSDMLAALADYPAEARLAVVRAAESNAKLVDNVVLLASDPDLDVACAALRFLSNDEDLVGKPRVATALLTALQDGSPEKKSAVIERIDLPAIEVNDPALSDLLEEYSRPEGPTPLDPLYEAFRSALDGGEPADAPVIPGALGEIAGELQKEIDHDSPLAFRAALALGEAGHAGGLQALLSQLPGLSTAQKSAIAEDLYNPRSRDALSLLRQLLREPVSEIRTAAARSALSNSTLTPFTAMVLEELEREGSSLQPGEVYSYSFERVARNSGTSRVVGAWAERVLRSDHPPTGPAVLALIAAQRGSSELVQKLAVGSSDPWIRRAAFRRLAEISPHSFTSALPVLLDDPSPWVRAALPEATGTMPTRWQHRFDDTHALPDNSYDSVRSRRRLHVEAEAALVRMAKSDPSPENRFEAAFALLSHGKAIDADGFASLIARQPADARASYRLARWMSDHDSSLGAGLAPVVSSLDTTDLSPEWIQKISAAVNADAGDDEGDFASFSGLVSREENARTASQQTRAGEEQDLAPERTSLRLVYFFKPGCKECAQVHDYLDDLRKEFPLLQIDEHNILEARGTLLNQALGDRFGVPSDRQNIAPSVFVQTGFLVGADILPRTLGPLLSATMDAPQDDDWAEVGETEMDLADTRIRERFESLTLPIVLAAGLLDGINPCAFATIIFFLSYLQVARRTPREMLIVGASFIVAVFLAYLAAGLALHRFLALITEHVSGIQTWLNAVFGGLALLAAVLSLRDAWLARRGRAADMTLQLPAFLKTRIRSVIRTGAKARRFVIAAFVAGIVISLLELACTGQVYAPIIYQIQQGSANAFGLLILYNLAFILPLVVIFLAVWAGLKSEALIRVQTRFTATVKVLLALLFLALAALMFFGTHWIGH